MALVVLARTWSHASISIMIDWSSWRVTFSDAHARLDLERARPLARRALDPRR
jgi:hypothetical protein